MHTLIPIHNGRSLVSATYSTRATGTILVIVIEMAMLYKKRGCPLSYMVKYRNLPRISLIVLLRPGICLRPSIYCLSSSVYPRCVIETGVYSKPACIQENTVDTQTPQRLIITSGRKREIPGRQTDRHTNKLMYVCTQKDLYTNNVCTHTYTIPALAMKYGGNSPIAVPNPCGQ